MASTVFPQADNNGTQSRPSTAQQLDQVARLAGELFTRARLDVALQTTMRLARETIPADAATVMLSGADGRAHHTAATEPDAARADALQVSGHEGPSLLAFGQGQTVLIDDLRFDSRWRFWAPQAADLGYRSMLCLSLDDGDTSGSLNLYARHSSFFASRDLGFAEAFARHASIAIAIAQEREQLLVAAHGRGTVGQAQGILMQRYAITADQASTVLRRYSSHLNVTLRDLATSVIADRRLPDLDVTADRTRD